MEYDIGCEDIIKRHGSVKRAELVVGQRRYRTVVLPPLTENLNTRTMDLLPAYLLGQFTLEPADSGFVVAPHAPLKLADHQPRHTTQPNGNMWLSGVGWNRQGYPFYAAGVAYSQPFQIPQPRGRYRVELPAWYGSVAKVIVNGTPAGHIAYRPWQCDVTEWIRPGVNTIEVVVIGTLKNTLGPHHAGAVRGFASPQIFDRAPALGPPPGREYDTIGYGLFEPFVLRRADR